MNVGDIVICKKSCMYYPGSGAVITINKTYKIFDITKHHFYIKNDNDDSHGFGLNEDTSYYGKWFYTSQELRKLKLKKLNESRGFSHS
jgi:hypothetical protein